MKNPLLLSALLLAASLVALGQDELKAELEETLFELTEQLEQQVEHRGAHVGRDAGHEKEAVELRLLRLQTRDCAAI